MARKISKKQIVVINDCSLCIASIKQNDKLYCKLMIKDISLKFPESSEVNKKEDCKYYKEKSHNH